MIAGIDEAGRGCLAGPVVAAAVILPASFNLPGLNDSKLLKENVRKELSGLIRAQAVSFAFGIIWPAVIDRINILQATLLAMAKAAIHLKPFPSKILIDGNASIPVSYFEEFKKGAFMPPLQETIVKGDRLEPAISAASILAKTARDDIMRRLDETWPQYGFARHKGYGTKEHIANLAKFGPSPMHRLTFRRVLPDKKLFAQLNLL